MKRTYKIVMLTATFLVAALIGIPRFIDDVRAGIP